MANENLKKFLDSAGVSHLWTKIDKKVKDEIKDLKDNVIGTVPNDANNNARTVVEYIEDLTEGIVTDGVISELQKDVDKNKEDIKGLQEAAGDYVTTGQLASYETVANADKVRERVGVLEKYTTDNDAALDEVRTTANNAATKTYVDKALEGKASLSDFEAVQTTVNNFFADDAAINGAIDTLKEIINYLDSNPEDNVNIVTDLATISNKVNNLLNTGDKTVTTYVTDAIESAFTAFKNGDYATDIGKLEDAIDTINQRLDNITIPSLDGYATEAYVQNYVATNVIALTNEEIDTAIGATQN